MQKLLILVILLSIAGSVQGQDADNSDNQVADTAVDSATGNTDTTASGVDDEAIAAGVPADDGTGTADATTPGISDAASDEGVSVPATADGGETADTSTDVPSDAETAPGGADDDANTGAGAGDVDTSSASVDNTAITGADDASVPAVIDGSNDTAAGDGSQDATDADTATTPRRQIRRLGDVTRDPGTEWTLDIPQGLNIQQQPTIDVQVPDTQLNNQLQQVLIDQANSTNSLEVAGRLETVLLVIEQRADANLTSGDIQQAAAYIAAITALDGNRAGLTARQTQLQSLLQLQTLQAQLDQAFVDDRLLEPDDDNALAYLNQILAIDATNAQALASRDELQQRLLDQADTLATSLDFEQASSLLDQIEALAGNADVDAARQALVDQRQAHAADLEDQSRAALDAGNLDQAEQLLNDLIALGNADQSAERLRQSIADVRQYGGMVPGQVFRDSYAGGSAQGPVMMVLPAGGFMMGSPDSEAGRRDSESPRFRVTFERGFALSQREITVEEFRRFIQSSGYRTDAERLRESSYYDEDSGRLGTGDMSWQNDYSGGRAEDDMPVVHVSWNDANAYAQWLADVTQRQYRLPSEAELEYAIRGDTQTAYWWGDDSPNQDDTENVTGSGDISSSRRRWNDSFENYEDGYWGPAPVANMQANPFGLFDINGNVKEWAADCWHVNYNRAPTDGSAWINAGCESRVVRGADWSSTPVQSRSAMRISARMQVRGPRVGIRLARDL